MSEKNDESHSTAVRNESRQETNRSSTAHNESRQETIRKPIYNFFESELVKNMVQQMPVEELKSYESMGKIMHDNMDFTADENLEKKKEPSDDEILQYCIKNLKSGLSISDLDMKEIQLLEKKYGKEWYTEFGYTIEDLGEVAENVKKNIINPIKKVGRNEKCPCGSGKKFKVCHLNKKYYVS